MEKLEFEGTGRISGTLALGICSRTEIFGSTFHCRERVLPEGFLRDKHHHFGE